MFIGERGVHSSNNNGNIQDGDDTVFPTNLSFGRKIAQRGQDEAGEGESQ